MILQELIESLSKTKRRNTTITIKDSNYNDVCICSVYHTPEEYLNLTLINWDFDVSINLGFTDSEQFSLAVDLEVVVECL